MYVAKRFAFFLVLVPSEHAHRVDPSPGAMLIAASTCVPAPAIDAQNRNPGTGVQTTAGTHPLEQGGPPLAFETHERSFEYHTVGTTQLARHYD